MGAIAGRMWLTDADKGRRRHYSLSGNPQTQIDVLKYYLKQMKLAQSRTHNVDLRLGPTTAFSTSCNQYKIIVGVGVDVRLQRVPGMVEVNDDGNEVVCTDGAGLIGRSVMQKIVQHYKHHNPKAHVLPDLCAFQGRVGPNKGVWVVWPEHILKKQMNALGLDIKPEQDVLLFLESQQKWMMPECKDSQIEVSGDHDGWVLVS